MDDFNAGPRKFNITIDTSDPAISSQQSETDFRAVLGKPLEFNGEWEVALTQLVMKPSLLPIQVDNNIIIVNDSEANVITSFELDTNKNSFLSNNNLINFFNSNVPKKFKDRLSISMDSSGCLKLVAKDLKMKISRYLGHLLGFEPEIWIESKIANFKPNLMGNTGICKVLCDIVAPQIYGSGNLQILHKFVIPENVQYPINLIVHTPTYLPIIRSFVSTMNFSMVDTYNNLIQLNDKRYPIIITLSFRKL